MTEPPAEAAADIFISYARDDATFAARLRKGIEEGGFSVWMDTTSMAGGERYTKEIESAIEGATSVVVVVSASSNESEWVRREVLYAQQLGKRVVPVLAAQVPLPVHLVNLNALALHEDFNAGLDRLLNALRGETADAAAVAGKRTPPVQMGKALWLFAGAAVVLVLAVINARGEGVVAEALATGLLIGSVLLAVAWKADDAISLDFKRDLSLWLDGVDPAAVVRPMQRWPEHFAALFDHVFTKKHLSWRCFFRSSIASLLALLLCTLIFIQAAPVGWVAYMSQFGWGEGLMWLGVVAAIANLLPDYVSLLETRWVIRRMQQTPSLVGQLGWLLMDFVATAAIFLVLALSSWSIAILIDGGAWEDVVGNVLSLLAQVGRWSLLDPAVHPLSRFWAIFVWTTYFTTVWVWLYFVAQFLMRLTTPLRRTLSFLKYGLPIKQRPLRAVGQVMALVACVSYCLVMLLASALGDSAPTAYLEPEMVVIEAGEFEMGCVSGKDCDTDELPVHKVTFGKDFAIGKYEVTFEEYDLFVKATGRARPSDEGFGRRNRPVINVSWVDALEYAAWLSEQASKRYRLPTEAEWEYAARAGTTTMYWWGDEIGVNRASCFGCGSQWDREQTVPVGSFEPNPWQLHDTAGSVWEWVQDCWHDDYSGSPPNDGSTWKWEGGGNCRQRVARGGDYNVRVDSSGSWVLLPRALRSAGRNEYDMLERLDNLGFRLVQDLD